jgi:hypothetical protein
LAAIGARPATAIGAIVLAQIPSLNDVIGILPVIGVALHKPAAAVDQAAQSSATNA